MGCSDSETISSQLQKIIGLPYRVVNYSNFAWLPGWDRQLELLRRTRFGRKDIIVLLNCNTVSPLENQWGHWLHWSGFKKPVVKADALPLFYRNSRKEYFLLPNVYTPECNRDLAEFIRDTIRKKLRSQKSHIRITSGAVAFIWKLIQKAAGHKRKVRKTGT